MAVEFSAVKDQLLRHDGVARFAALADSMTPALRLQGVWGLSSVAYMSTQEVGGAAAAGLEWVGIAHGLPSAAHNCRVGEARLSPSLGFAGACC